MLKLSIIVNMFNTAKYLPKCMDTLLHQDIPQEEYEIILVDDCSSDNSVELANAYAQKYFNIRIIKHETNRGLPAARNTGIDAVKGEYFCFVDPDDYIETNSISTLLSKMKEEDLDLLKFNYQKVDENYNFVLDNKSESKFDYSPKVMTGCDFIATKLGVACYVWSYIYKTKFIQQSNIKFIEGGYFDDTPWLSQILQVASRISCINIRHQYYLQRGGSLVHTHNSVNRLKKINGQIHLVEELYRQKTIAINDIRPWYDMMIAHSVISILTSISLIDNKYSSDLLIRLENMKIWPLKMHKLSFKNALKVFVINLNPFLFIKCMRFIYHVKCR